MLRALRILSLFQALPRERKCFQHWFLESMTILLRPNKLCVYVHSHFKPTIFLSSINLVSSQVSFLCIFAISSYIALTHSCLSAASSNVTRLEIANTKSHVSYNSYKLLVFTGGFSLDVYLTSSWLLGMWVTSGTPSSVGESMAWLDSSFSIRIGTLASPPASTFQHNLAPSLNITSLHTIIF